MMSNIQTYTNLLRLRNAMKRLQQLSWTVTQLEKKYDIDLLSDEEKADLHDAYISYAPEIKMILDELTSNASNKK